MLKSSLLVMVVGGVLVVGSPACGGDDPPPGSGRPRAGSSGAAGLHGDAGQAGHGDAGGDGGSKQNAGGDTGSGQGGRRDPSGGAQGAGRSSGGAAAEGGSSDSGGSGGSGGSGTAGTGEAGDAGSGGSSTLPTVPAGCGADLNPTVATDFYAAMRCLFEGPTAVQRGVEPGVIEPRRISVLRGRVLDQSGEPLRGVTVTVLRGPEYGETQSRADGYYDLAVNGGGPVTLVLAKEGFLASQRHRPTEWRRYSIFPDIVLLERAPASPPVTLAELTEPAVVRGPVQEDASGERRHRVLLRPETQATAVLGDGSEQPLDTVTLRMTEFTVGDLGPSAMPGELPPTSAYTYAIDISTDEGSAAGADTVRFEPPIPTYVDNFLGFPAGTVVPNGYFDRAKDAWEPAESGVVIAIIAESAGLAAIDLTGDGVAEDTAALAAAGIDEDEQRALADEYAPGASLWRTELPHLSIWDHNWPFRPPTNAIAPALVVTKAAPAPCPTKPGGSNAMCEDQSLGQGVGLSGTPLGLQYQSERMPGRLDQSTLNVDLGAMPAPDTAKAIVIESEVLGQVQTERIEGSPPATWSYTWNGEDAYGRAWQGREEARVRVGFVYDGVYEGTSRFAAPGNGTVITGDRARSEVTLFSNWRGAVGGFSQARTGLGGWTLGVHDVLDADGGVLYRGDGTQSSVELTGGVIERIAGTGTSGYGGDGGPALEATLSQPHGFAVRPDGAVLFAEYIGNRIRIMYPDGTIDTFAGNGTTAPLGDGGPATEAAVEAPLGLALAPDGTLYVTGHSAARTIRAIAPDGTISTFAGGGTPADGVGDGGPALGAQFTGPHALVLSRDGSLIVADDQGNRVRRIGPDGLVSTIFGTGAASSTGDGGLATAANVRFPTGLAEAPDGSLYVAEFQGHRVRRVRPDGRVETIAGTGVAGFLGDGGPATLARFNQPHSLALGPDGSLYVTDEGNRRVRRIRPDGTVVTVAGNGGSVAGGDGGSPLAASFTDLKDVHVHTDGSLWVLDFGPSVVRRIRPAFPSFLVGETPVASADGRLVSVFDTDGRHLRTVDALHGVTEWSFGYDAGGQLTTVTDKFGLVTEIERSSAGIAQAIVGPYGARTTLTFDENDYLQSIEDPAGEKRTFDYDEQGLLTAWTEPLGAGGTGYRHEFTYDALGRLLTETSPSGLVRSFAREELGAGAYATIFRQNGARSERHEVTPGADTTDALRAVTSAAGAVVTTTQRASGGTATSPTFASSWTTAADPRFGTVATYAATERFDWQTSLRADVTRTRTAVTTGGDPLALQSLDESFTLNGATTTTHYDRATRTLVATSPLGRLMQTVFDERGLVVSRQRGSLAPLELRYDDSGRLTEREVAGNVTKYTYDDAGFVASIENALGEVVAFENDALGRVVRRINPDASELVFQFDKNGQLTRLETDEAVTHSLSFAPGGLLTEYGPPDVAGLGESEWGFGYDAFESLASLSFGGEPAAVTFAYDAAGRLTTVNHDAVSDSFTYEATGGRLLTAASANLTSTLTYTGALPTRVTYSGLLSGTVDWVYDTSLRITSQTVVGTTAVPYKYDADSLLTGAGGMTLTRSASDGFVTATALGVVTDARGYDSRGLWATYAASISGTAAYAWSDAFDGLGRVSQRTETVLGETHAFTYDYDGLGRLTSVLRDGAASEAYSYDARGNRIAAEVGGVVASGTYDAQDRLKTYRGADYELTPDGTLRRRTRGSEVTEYTYDALGRLRSVTLADGRVVEYVLDALGRRIGRKLDGALTHRWMYGLGGELLADRGPSGSTTVARYVFGSRAHTPDYMLRGSSVYRIVTDAIGSVRLVVSTTDGSVAQRIDYDSFGRVLLDTAPGFQPFGFAGGLYDPDTGLVRFGARDYDADTGRWTAKDPSLFEGGQANLYEYVGSDPVNRLDPSGLESWSEKAGAAWDATSDALDRAGDKAAEVYGTYVAPGVEWVKDHADDLTRLAMQRITRGFGAVTSPFVAAKEKADKQCARCIDDALKRNNVAPESRCAPGPGFEECKSKIVAAEFPSDYAQCLPLSGVVGVAGNLFR